MPVRRSMIAGEGWPWLAAAVVLCALVWLRWGLAPAAPLAVLATWFYLLFRDPPRQVPPLPLAVLAPVDGRVTDVGKASAGLLPGDWTRIAIRATHLGTYTVRAPIEGTILDVRDEADRRDISGLWLRTEEDDDIVLLFPGRSPRFGPKTFARYGERLGQGQRFAYLRLASRAEIYVPASARVQVTPGDRVRAGIDVLADLVRA